MNLISGSQIEEEGNSSQYATEQELSQLESEKTVLQNESIEVLTNLTGVTIQVAVNPAENPRRFGISKPKRSKKTMAMFMSFAVGLSLLLSSCSSTTIANEGADMDKPSYSENLVSGFSGSAIESALKVLGNAIPMLNERNETANVVLSNPKCVQENERPSLIEFSSGKVDDVPLEFAACNVQLAVEGSTIETAVLVEKNGQSSGTQWVIFGQGAVQDNPNYAWGYMVPIVDGKLDLSSKQGLKKIETMRDIARCTLPTQ